MPAVQLYDPCRHPVQERAVMGDRDDTALEINQQVLQPRDRVKIEVVGGLIEKKNFWSRHQRLAQCDTFSGATGQGTNARVAVEVEPIQRLIYPLLPVPAVLRFNGILQHVQVSLSGAVGVDHGDYARHADAHYLKYSGVQIQCGFLRNECHTQVLLKLQQAVIGTFEPGENSEQRRLAGSVAADQADAFRRFKGETGLVKQGDMAKSQLRIDQGNKGHSGTDYPVDRPQQSAQLPERARTQSAVPASRTVRFQR